MEEQRDEKSHKCDFCALKLENYHLLCQHLLQFHNIAFIQCEYCNLELPSKSELVKHVKEQHTYGGNPRVECSICPATFLSLKGLNRHMNQNHNPDAETHPCKKCDKVYKNRSSLLNHLKVVHSPLPYIKCDKCSKCYSTKKNLKSHQKVEHDADYKRYQCPSCPSSFKHKPNLGQHIRSKHYTKTPSNTPNSYNKCNLCSEIFPDKTSLLNHRKNFHKRLIEIFSCDRCSAVFKLKEAFRNHLWEEHKVIQHNYGQEDGENYLFQEFNDFENIMKNDIELSQLMEIRKSRKFSQKLVIISYKQQQDEDPLLVDELDADAIRSGVNLFFNCLIKPNKEHCKNDSEISFESEAYAGDGLENCKDQSNDAESNQYQKASSLDESVDYVNNFESFRSDADSSACKQIYSNDNTNHLLKKDVVPNIGESEVVKPKSNPQIKKSQLSVKRNTNQIKWKKTKSLLKDDNLVTIDSSSQQNKKYSKVLKFDCGVCKKSFKHKTTLTRHVYLTHNRELTTTLMSPLQESVNSDEQGSNVMFPCKHCGALFPCVELLRNHCSWQHSN